MEQSSLAVVVGVWVAERFCRRNCRYFRRLCYLNWVVTTGSSTISFEFILAAKIFSKLLTSVASYWLRNFRIDIYEALCISSKLVSYFFWVVKKISYSKSRIFRFFCDRIRPCTWYIMCKYLVLHSLQHRSFNSLHSSCPFSDLERVASCDYSLFI